MPKQPNKDPRILIHVAIPEQYHRLFKMHTSESGSNITATTNTLIENYLVENGMIKKN